MIERELGHLFSVQVATPTILPCEVDREPGATVEFSWLKDGQPLVIRDDSRVRLLDPTNSGSLRIEGVVYPDAGTYQCLVSTSFNGLQAPQVRSNTSTVQVTGQYKKHAFTHVP